MAKPNVIGKEELLVAAKKCLVKNGLEKFTLRSVAEIGGVTQGTVYYHFRTKERLLLEIVKDICDSSWDELSSQENENIVKQALESAKSRCSYASFYHKLFFTLLVSGFTNEKIREQLGHLLTHENKALSGNLSKIWSTSPISGVSLDTWGIFFNAIVDGLALQALLVKDFSVERTFNELECLFGGLRKLSGMEEDR